MNAAGQGRRRALFLFTEVFAKGGIQRFNQTLLEACEVLGIQNHVLSLNDSMASMDGQPRKPGDSVIGFAGNRLRFILAVARTLLRNRYDRVIVGHINLLTLADGVMAFCPYRSRQSILIAHGIEVWSGIRMMRRRALRRVDRILCVSRYTRQRILEQVPGLIAERLIVFPNALAETWRRDTPAAVKRSLPDRFVLSVTRLEPGDRYKGIASVIEAVSMLSDDSIHYLVVGRGTDLRFLELVAERCGVKERVHFVNDVSDAELIALYQKCHAFVLPSGKEGFGIVFLEAMFFGAPVIAAKEKGAIDVVRNGETGISVPFGDTIAIKDAIETLSIDGELRARVCENGRAMVTAEGAFTFSRFTRRCAAVFGVSDTTAA